MQERLTASIVGQLWLALDRAQLAEQTDGRLARLELLYRLSDELASSPDLDGLVGLLAGPLRATSGFELIDIYLLPPRGFGNFSSRPPGKELGAVIRRLQRSSASGPIEHQGLTVVPMRLEGELRGVIRLRPQPHQNRKHDEFLLAIAGGVAALVARARLSAQVAARESELAVVQERERIAADLHDTLGQSLFALSLNLSECATTVRDEALRKNIERARGMADAAGVQLRQAIHALAFLQGSDPDLPGSLRSLAAELDTTVDVDVRCLGRPRTLEPARAEALLRVAREALVNVNRHSRATRARVTLRYKRAQVELVVADNGTGLGQRTSGYDAGLHFGLRTMRRRLEQVQGSLAFEDVLPSGLRICATVPTD
jgi:signal transduction histidine kinase